VKYKDLIMATYGDTEFNPSVSAFALATFIERNGPIPKELSDLLNETDGVSIGDMVSIFSIEARDGYTFQSVLDEWDDPEYQKLYPNSQGLFFFADDGMGGFFGYRRNTELDAPFGPICYWDHESDTVQQLLEHGLEGFIRTCEKYIE
jgi:hypothetical protein